MLGCNDLVKHVNNVYGFDFGLIDYALYICHTVDVAKAVLMLIDLLIKRINLTTSALKSDDIKELDKLLPLIRDKPHLFVKPLYPKNALSQSIDKLDAEAMNKVLDLVYAFDEIDETSDDDVIYDRDTKRLCKKLNVDTANELKSKVDTDTRKCDTINKLLIYIMVSGVLKTCDKAVDGEQIMECVRNYTFANTGATFPETVGWHCRDNKHPERHYAERLAILLSYVHMNRDNYENGSRNAIPYEDSNLCWFEAYQFDIAKTLLMNKRKGHLLELVHDYLGLVDLSHIRTHFVVGTLTCS
jgi:hypothetical protein